MIGFERTGVTASNSGNRPPTAAIAYPKLLMFEKSRLVLSSARSPMDSAASGAPKPMPPSAPSSAPQRPIGRRYLTSSGSCWPPNYTWSNSPGWGEQLQKFIRVDFRYSFFDSCYLRDCHFDSCNFTGCRFVNTHLPGAKFSGCTFDYVTFEKTFIDPRILDRSEE